MVVKYSSDNVRSIFNELDRDTLYETGTRPRPQESAISSQRNNFLDSTEDSKLRLRLSLQLMEEPYFESMNAEIGVAVGQLLFTAQKSDSDETDFYKFLQLLKEGDFRRKEDPLKISFHLSQWLAFKKFIRPTDSRIWVIMDANEERFLDEKPQIIARQPELQRNDKVGLYEIMAAGVNS